MKEWLGKENCMSPEQVNAWLTISPASARQLARQV